MSTDTNALRALCPLEWQGKGRHDIYGTEGCEFAQFGDLEHSVGPAGFEVYTDLEDWFSTFWHGNRGHQLGRFASQGDAKKAAQAHADKLVASFAPALLDAADRLAALEAELATAQAEARELRAELARVRELCPEVIAFAHLMQHKLNMNAHKDGEGWGRDSWKSCSPQFLMDKLYEEVLELTIAIHEGDSAKSIRQEAADVGNIAMMLADVCGALSPAPEPILSTCPVCGDPDDHEHDSMAAPAPELPLMARRSWMRRDTDYFVVHGDFCLEIKAFGRAPHFDESGELLVCAETRDLIERDEVDAEAQPDGIYRIADTDEHGLPVIPRGPGMPEGKKYRVTIGSGRVIYQSELEGVGFVDTISRRERIEDYVSAAQESGDAQP